MLSASRCMGFDRSRGWSFDRRGRLRVAMATLSKAGVNRYHGSEIPGGDPQKFYRVWRHPDEMEKAARSFNELPLMVSHASTTATDHKRLDTVGTTGTTAHFAYPYLRNGITLWTDDAIRGVEDRTCCALSCGYSYTAVFRRGMTPDGVPFDFVMTAIVGHHVAIVPRGRAGPEARVDNAAGHARYARPICRPCIG